MNTPEIQSFEGILHRAISAGRKTIDAANRLVELSFSSESPVEQWFGREILDHAPTSVDLSRLNNGAPVLLNHDQARQVGVIEKAWIDHASKRGRALVRFSESSEAESVFKDVLSGIRTKVSVGYVVRHAVPVHDGSGEAGYRVVAWQPLEISVVSIPADDSVGVGRSLTYNHPNPMPPINTQPTSSVDVSQPVDQPTHRNFARETAEIMTMGRRFGFIDDAAKFIESGRSPDDFRVHVLNARGRPQPLNLADPSIGMSRSEVSRYSIVRALNCLANGRAVDGIEGEASAEVARRCQRETRGFLIPHDIASRSLADSRQLTRHDIEAIIGRLDMQRALNATSATAGGFLVGTDTIGSSMIELLRNKALVSQLGATMLTGLVGNIAIPRHTGGATAYWLTETASVTSSQQTFGQLGLTPHRLASSTPYSKQLLAQASVDVEALVRNDLMQGLAIAKDMAAINGSGASGEPIGILNTTGLGSVTFGAAATWAKILEFESTLATANADRGNIAWLTTPATRGKWKGAVKVSDDAGAGFIWEVGGKVVNGYRAEATAQVPSNKVIFGNWSDLMLADWDGMDVVVDPYTLAKSHQVEVTITLLCDIGVRHAASFVISTDSGAQ